MNFDDIFDQIENLIDGTSVEGKIELDYTAKCLLWTIRALDKLHKLGLVSEGPFRINNVEWANELLGDFKPAMQDIEDVMTWMKKEGFVG